MKCNHCGKKIGEYDKFYELDGKFYCKECVREDFEKFYIIEGNIYTSKELTEYSNIDEYDSIHGY